MQTYFGLLGHLQCLVILVVFTLQVTVIQMSNIVVLLQLQFFL